MTRSPATSQETMHFDVQRPECESAIESLWEYLDAELAPGAARIVGAHFDICERCRPRVSSSLALKRAVRRSAPNERAPESLRERVLPPH